MESRISNDIITGAFSSSSMAECGVSESFRPPLSHVWMIIMKTLQIRTVVMALWTLFFAVSPGFAWTPDSLNAAGEGTAVFLQEAGVEKDTDAMYLTLSQAITKALSSNLDLRISSYDPLIAEEDIGRALSDFDPRITGTVSYSFQREPSFSAIIPTTRTRRWTFNAGLETRVLSGASLALSTRNVRTSTNNFFISEVSPFYTTELALSITQPLMRNAGVDINRTSILIAQNNFRIGKHQFEEQVMQLVLDVETAYWNLVFARDDLTAKMRSLEAAEAFLRDMRIKADAGAVAPIEVTRARARVAERQEAIVTATAQISNAEDALRRLLRQHTSSFLSTDQIVPTDAPTVHAEQLSLAQSVNYALSRRPQILRQRIALESYDILIARAKNQLLPQVDLFGTYSLNGLGDSWSDNFDMVGTLDMRSISTGLSVSIPIGNRRARSEYSQTRYERHQALANYAITERDVTLSVKRAIRDVSTSLQSIETNRFRVEASREHLEAERQRFEVGQSVSLDVLDAQEALQQAESALIAATVRFRQAMAAYRRHTGSILEDTDIHVLAPSTVTRKSEPLFP